MLGEKMRIVLLSEMLRISQQVLVLFTTEFTSIVSLVDEWPWISLELFLADCEQYHWKVISKEVFHGVTIVGLKADDGEQALQYAAL